MWWEGDRAWTGPGPTRRTPEDCEERRRDYVGPTLQRDRPIAARRLDRARVTRAPRRAHPTRGRRLHPAQRERRAGRSLSAPPPAPLKRRPTSLKGALATAEAAPYVA